MNEELIVCSRCGKALPKECFYTERKKKNGLRSCCKNCDKIYKQSIKGRASTLLEAHKKEDKLNGRIGEIIPPNYINQQWIIENIFTKPCAHCGKTGWQAIGCNRLDNSKPHTIDNVEPCCSKCNNILAHKEQGKTVHQINPITGEIVEIYSSELAAAKAIGGDNSYIGKCCKKNLMGYGFIWKHPTTE